MRFEKDTVVLHRAFYEMDMSLAELVVYATIYGYCQDGESKFYGSRDVLAEKAKCTDRTIRTVLASLQEKGYVKKCEMVVNGVPRVALEAVEIFSNDRKFFPKGAEIFSNGLNNNIYNNTIKENKEENKERAPRKSADAAPQPTKTTPVNRFFLSSTEKASVNFDPDRIAEMKREQFIQRTREKALELKVSRELFYKFVDYWCEHNAGSDRLRCEDERFFDTGKRLGTFIQRERKYEERRGGYQTAPQPQSPPNKVICLNGMSDDEIDMMLYGKKAER